MESAFFDNRSAIIKDDLVQRIEAGDRISVAASLFSMYAYRELREQLESVDEFRFIFTSQTFIKDRAKKEAREFYIPRLNREHGLFGTEFEIKLRNELTQKAIAFQEGSVKHIYFVAETKGAVEQLELKGIENAKIACAKKLFNMVNTSEVRYSSVDSYEKMLEIIGALE